MQACMQLDNTSNAGLACRQPPRPVVRASARAPRPRTLRIAAAGSSAAPSTSLEDAVQVLYRAAETSAIPPKEVFAAMRQLQKAAPKSRDQMAEWPAILGGNASPGRRWRLVFTTGTKDVQAALKGLGAGGGRYFPLTAVQRWDASQGEIENGIFLGRLAALTFKGPYSFEGKLLPFDFDTLTLRLGPWRLPISLKEALPRSPGSYKLAKGSPFFSFFYIDDRIAAAQGRGGGLAIWARTSPSWELERGIS